MGTKIVSEEAQEQGFGLGDAVEVVAKPIAQVLGIQDCLPCERRKQALNAASARAKHGIRRMFRRRPVG